MGVQCIIQEGKLFIKYLENRYTRRQLFILDCCIIIDSLQYFLSLSITLLVKPNLGAVLKNPATLINLASVQIPDARIRNPSLKTRNDQVRYQTFFKHSGDVERITNGQLRQVLILLVLIKPAPRVQRYVILSFL